MTGIINLAGYLHFKLCSNNAIQGEPCAGIKLRARRKVVAGLSSPRVCVIYLYILINFCANERRWLFTRGIERKECHAVFLRH